MFGQTERKIALSFGVPPMLLGIPGDNTYSNYAEANRAFYRQTVVPLLSRIAAALGNWLGAAFGEELRLVPDLEEVPALSVEREALWKRVGDANFLSDDEKRAATGYDPLPASFAPSSIASLRAKFNPDQPRVPAGNPDGGQWTGGGAGSDGIEEGDQDEALPLVSVSDDEENGSFRIDLLEEEQRGGHAIREHVNKSESYLKERVEREARAIIERGDDFRGLSVGSFPSLVSATKLVNSTLAQNSDVIDRVVRGIEPIGIARAQFNSVTGHEAYLSRFHAQPVIRETYGVSVVILPDVNSPRGFRVQSAFPSN